MRRENERLRAVVAFLGKVQLDVAGLARSTFFYHQTRLQAPDRQEDLKTAITEIFKRNHGRFGHRRIHTALVKQGWTIAK